MNFAMGNINTIDADVVKVRDRLKHLQSPIISLSGEGSSDKTSFSHEIRRLIGRIEYLLFVPMVITKMNPGNATGTTVGDRW
jgi:hypothetical protein